MNNPALRKTLINLHLLFAGFMAPVFILLAVSGGLYLLGQKGSLDSQRVTLPAGASLDFKSDTLEADVRALLERAEIDYDFDYIKDRGTRIELRPTSKTYYAFEQTPNGLTATRHVPDFQKSMIELHKGHGPALFKTYQKLVALVLIGVVLGGILVGLLAKAYRSRTLVSLALGTIIFLWLALLA